MGEKTSLSSRMGLEEEKSRMMRVAERVAMRGRAEEEEEEEDVDADAGDDLEVIVLMRRREEEGEEWTVGEKAATQPMILEWLVWDLRSKVSIQGWSVWAPE